MAFEKDKKEYEVVKEGQEDILKINAESWTFTPSIEDNNIVMAYIIDKIVEVPSVSRIVFVQRRNYVYDYNQVQLLLEIANIYKLLTKQKKALSIIALGFKEDLLGYFSSKYMLLQDLIFNLLRNDPIGAYVELKRLIRDEKITQKKLPLDFLEYESRFMEILKSVYDMLDKTRLINLVREDIAGYKLGDRSLYKLIFRPAITPDFIFTRLMIQPPLNGEELDIYSVDNTDVTIFSIPEDIKPLYHMTPPEFKISEDRYELLDLARTVMAEHKPKEEEFLDPERMRTTFFNIGRDLIQELAEHRNINLNIEELNELTNILIRYTVGFGLIELLLKDQKVQDITVNGPVGQSPIFIVHEDFYECATNIVPSVDDAESWASKFRILSGRPLDEANPVLDTELAIPGARARVAIIQKPLNPYGLGFSLRRHRDNPWTLPLFIQNRMMNPLAAGLLSFLIDGARSILFCGTRSSGKCVDGNTLIQLSDGNIIQIKELVGELKETIDDGWIYSPKDYCSVPCFKKFNLTSADVTQVWKRKSPEKVIKLKTKSGKEIITTCEHPYFIYEGGLKNIRADNLKTGDLIASPRKINVQGRNIFLRLSREDFAIEELPDTYIIKGRTNAVPFKFPKGVDANLAEFLGLIIGDGHLDLTKLEFHNLCFELREKYKSFLKLLGIPYREFKSRTSIVISVSNRNLSRILNRYFDIPFGKKSDKVVIPKLILKSNNDVLAAFLRGYFDTDGYIPKDKRDIEIATASKVMSEQLVMALLRFGIVSFSKPKKVNNKIYHRVLIRGSFVNAFKDKISFSHPFKKERIDSLFSLDYLNNTNVDVVPDGNKIITALRNKLRLSPKDFRSSGKDYWAWENNKYRVTRNWFKKIIDFYKVRYSKLLDYKEQIDTLRAFVDFDHKDYFSNIERLRILLGLSYVCIASDVKLSDRAIRGSLQDNVLGKFENVRNITLLTETFKGRINELEKSLGDNFYVENIPSLINLGVASYAELSRKTNIPETTLKDYSCGNRRPVQEVCKLIEEELLIIKQNLVGRLKEANNLLANMGLFLPTYMQVGLILANMRNILNIGNEEFISNSVSITTVSNFFCGKYQNTRFAVVSSIIKSVIKIYDSCIDNQTKTILQEVEMLANSDIFWDEVLSVEVIDRIDDFVFDLTVGEMHNFIANGLVAHNTSLLGAALVEIMRKYRIISIEDSVTGDSELLIKRNGKFERTTIGYLIDSLIERYGCWYNLTEHEVLGNDENIEILAMDKNGKIKLTAISKFIRHKVKKPIYKILTRTGREIKVTGDHSLFGLSHEGKISEVKAKELKKGSFIATPRSLPIFCKELKELNILDYLDRFEKAYVYGGDVKNFLKNHYYEVQQLGKEYGHNRSLRAKWIREGIVPVKILKDMKALGHNLKEINDAYFKIGGNSKGIPIKIKLNENLLTLIGLWLADGCYDRSSVILSSISEEERKIIYSVANELSLPVKMHSDEISLMINSITFKTFLREVLELKGNEYTKRIPNWAVSLTNEQLKYIVRGLFSGDGHAAEKEIMLALSSINMLRDIQTLLLRFGIIHRIGKLRKDRTYNSSISSNSSIRIFQKIGFLQNTKKEKLAKLAAKISTHDNSDIIPLFFETKKELRKIIPNFNYGDYILRDNNIGRNKMIQLTKQLPNTNNLIKNMEILANSDLYWDEIKEVEVIENFNDYVYDIAVPECESFIAGNIVAHNTLELPVDALRNLGYNIQAMKVRSALTKGGTEVPADEGIRTSLRMGDSSLIIGEIRSMEAIALWEAMRIGALANVVAGTIHGDSPYGVFDRVVNDLKVPKTSFKATDIIVISNPVRSADGLHKWRRIISITEVRKGWEEDPLKEKGFVDLMKYDPEKDELVPTDDLINGDSDILKSIAGNVKEWTGNWDALWSNILLRTKIKQYIVDYANKNKMNQILEAPFVISSNDSFHRISDKINQEKGRLDNDTIFSEWELWFKKEVKQLG